MRFDKLGRRKFLAGGLAAGTALALPGRAPRAAAAYPLLSNRRVTLIVGSEVGGGYDLCGRSLARHLERTVPGMIVDVKNVPQASGKLAAKMLQEGPADGSMFFTSTPGLLSAQVLQEEGVAFDLAEWGWLGKVAAETHFLVAGPSADFKTLDDLRAKKTPSPLSVRSKASYVYHEVIWINALLGTRIKPVPGYKAVEKDAALVNGEVMLTIQTYPTDRKLMDLPQVDVTLRVTEGDGPERFKDRPLLADLVADKTHFAPLLRFMDASADLFRWFAAPPKTAPDILAEWRRAFDETVASPNFIGEMGKLDFLVKPKPGAQIAEIIRGILKEQDSLRTLLGSSLACGEALAEGLDNACSHV